MGIVLTSIRNTQLTEATSLHTCQRKQTGILAVLGQVLLNNSARHIQQNRSSVDIHNCRNHPPHSQLPLLTPNSVIVALIKSIITPLASPLFVFQHTLPGVQASE
jgi:hypothetical protein